VLTSAKRERCGTELYIEVGDMADEVALLPPRVILEEEERLHTSKGSLEG
jgi:hypothetical protein